MMKLASNNDGGRLKGDLQCGGLSVGDVRLTGGVLLAPLSGISDVPFRRLARRFGASLVFSEMIASGELVRGTRESLTRAMRDGDGLHAVQLAGRETAMMQAAAERLAGEGADIIDINFGCPAKKVVGGLSGSALMREPDLAIRLVEATVEGAGRVPVTVKMRLGWDAASINAPELAARCESAGARMVTVHGRTRDQFYEGTADWAAIARVKAVVSVPVVANGDLVAARQAPAMRAQSGADALMIGRGACGRPWFPGLMAGALTHGELAGISFADLVREHYEDMLGHYGARAGLRHARKHLGWYLDRLSGAVETDVAMLRAELLRADEPSHVLALIASGMRGLNLSDLEPVLHPSLQEAA